MRPDLLPLPPQCAPCGMDLAALLLACGAGNTRAFASLHQRVRPELRRHALRLTLRSDIADDIVQESMIAIWRQSASFDPGLSSPMTWMFAIVRHKTFDHFRALRTRARLHASWADACALDPESAESPCSALESRQRSGQLVHSIDQMFAEQRLALRLVYLHELTHAEAASQMGKPLGSVKTWVRRGMLDLRRTFAPAAGAAVRLPGAAAAMGPASCDSPEPSGATLTWQHFAEQAAIGA